MTGAGISNIIAILGINITELLSKKINIPLIDEGKYLDTIRRKYYGYFVTKKDGIVHWRHAQEDFSHFESNNYVKSVKYNKDDLGNEIKYEAIGFVSKKRFVRIVIPSQGSTYSIVHIFNDFNNEYSDMSIGFGIFEDWDGNTNISPMILSKQPINNWKKIGRVTSKELEKKLWQIVENKLPPLLFGKLTK